MRRARGRAIKSPTANTPMQQYVAIEPSRSCLTSVYMLEQSCAWCPNSLHLKHWIVEAPSCPPAPPAYLSVFSYSEGRELPSAGCCFYCPLALWRLATFAPPKGPPSFPTVALAWAESFCTSFTEVLIRSFIGAAPICTEELIPEEVLDHCRVVLVPRAAR